MRLLTPEIEEGIDALPRLATVPPEAQGRERDDVRLMVVRPTGLQHARFRDLPRCLLPGDLVVVNTSATLPAAVDGRRENGEQVVVHVADELDDAGSWIVELRQPDGSGPILDGHRGERVHVPGALTLRLEAPRTGNAAPLGPRLWRAQTSAPVDRQAWLDEHGRPITYGHLDGRWPLDVYQPVFAREPGSAEMASAGRPFTDRLVVDLVATGVTVAPITLHAGVSSLEAGERPGPERFRVSSTTAALVNHTSANGGRIVAVGTTVTRALESAADDTGAVRPRSGWTDLVLGPEQPARIVNGLVTGWHDDGSSHLDLLRAVAGSERVEAAYAAARALGYRWHEFGDSCLFLPGR